MSGVEIENRLNEFFDRPVGLRQGNLPSPILFSLFIDEIALSLEQQGMRNIQILSGLIYIFLLPFVDFILF